MNGHFVKMQGAGNDFILIDNRRGIWPLDALHLRRWCDRRLGVGADQLLVLEETRRPDADFRYRIFNADGGEVEQCGNGARCMTRWVLERIFPGECVRFETMRAVIRGSIGKDGLVSVEMGMPILEADDLPFRTDGLSYCGGAWRGFGLSGTDELCVLAVGNPHAVRFGPMPEDEVFRRTGERLQDHPAFPEGSISSAFARARTRKPTSASGSAAWGRPPPAAAAPARPPLRVCLRAGSDAP